MNNTYQASIHKDIRFLLQGDALQKATSTNAFEDGRQVFENEQVLEHYSKQGMLYASVADSQDGDSYYRLSIIAGPSGQLSSDCECSNKSDMLCKHAVAALLAYNEPALEGEFQGEAKDTALRDRVKRGHSEVTVKHIEGEPTFGIWQAESYTSTTGLSRKYRVEIRSIHERINYCNCPDLANNQLATCKHIEAVLHQIHQLPRKAKTKQPKPFVYKSFGEDGDIWIQRTAELNEQTALIVDKYFDPQGRFVGVLPQDYYKFSNEIFGLDAITLCEDAKQYASAFLEKQRQKALGQKSREQILKTEGQLPGIKAELYPYQLEGVAFLVANGRALLADDMGLGKTLQSISAADYLIQNAGVRRVLVICPASLKQQWAREIARFTDYQSQVVHGTAEKRRRQYQGDHEFFVLNYELATRDLDDINGLLKPDLLILDEAQRIKNWRTKVASSIKAISSQYAFVLTGTPLENKLEELYSLMQVVDQDVLGPLWRYLNDYHILDDKGKVLGYRNLTELRERIASSMLRRNRTVVAAQLPDRTTVQLDVPMNKKQMALHDEALSHAGQFAAIAQKRSLTKAESNQLMAALQQARMACDAPGLVDKQTKGSPKLSELKTLVEQVCIDGNSKMVVFSQWKLMTDMVVEMLKQLGVGYAHLHGGVPSDKRGRLMNNFAQDELCQVFVSTDAGGSGLNLQSASVLVNLDIPWNPAILEQRNARVHRLGQTNKVQIILMVAEDAYEQRVLQLVQNKQALFDNVVDPEGNEDIVGASKKVLDQVMMTLQGQNLNVSDETLNSTAISSAKRPAGKDKRQPGQQKSPLPQSLSSADDEALIKGLQKLQAHFAQRLEQAVAQGGGVLLVINELTPEDIALSENLKMPLPVALVDAKTIGQLQQIGIKALSEDCERIQLPITLPGKPHTPWQLKAKDNLQAATELVGKQVNQRVVTLLCQAVATALSDIGNEDKLLDVEDIPSWLFEKALPQQLLSAEQTGLASRIIGLRQANIVMDTLVEKSIEECTELLSQIMPGQE